MKDARTRTVCGLAALLALSAAPVARAQFAFTAPTETTSGGTVTFTAHPGDTLTFVGTLTNNYGDELDDVAILPTFAGTGANFTFQYPQHISMGVGYVYHIYDTNAYNTLTITVKPTAALGNYAFYFDADALGDGSGDFTGDIYSPNYILKVVAGTPPAAPTGLTATAGSASVVLSWTPPAGVTGATYSVFRGTAAGGEGTTPVASNITGSTYTDSGLADGTAYYYTVETVAGGSQSGPSSEATATPFVPAPTGLTAATAHNQITLSWTAPAGVTGVTYTLYRGTTAGGEAAAPRVTGVKTTTYTDTRPLYGQANFYTVKTVLGAQSSAVSNEASATPVLEAPVAPALKAVAGDAKVTVTWNVSAGTTTYSVYRGVGSVTPTLLVSGLKTTATTDLSVTNGTVYRYQVVAVNSVGSSPKSNTVSATPAPIPAAPTALVATPGKAAVTLKWTAPSGPVTSYQVFRGMTAGGESATAIKTNLTTTAYADTHLTDGVTYYYTVKAVNGAGTSPASNEASAQPVP